MKQTFRLKLVALLIGVFSLCFVTQTASAYDYSFLKDSNSVKNVEDTSRKETGQTNARTQIDKITEKSDKATARQNRFDANKVKKCEKKQAKINAKLDTISARGAKQLEVFHAISTRVQTFYITKEYAVENYQTVVSELDALYDQSLVAVTSTQNAADAWSCTVQDPIVSMDTFKSAKRAEITTLKAYKNKVHELILLVKQAGGTN